MALSTVLGILLQASWTDGGLLLSEFEDVVALHDAELAQCRAKPVRGAAVLQIGISAEGSYEWNSVLEDSKPETAVCFVKVLRRWNFPARDVGTRVQFGWRATARPMPLESSTREWPGQIGRTDLANCYLAKRPAREAEGVIRAQLLVGPSGAVVEAKLNEVSPVLRSLEPCVLEATRFWSLNAMPRGVTMNASWSFSADAPMADAGASIAITPHDAPEDYRQQVEVLEAVRSQSRTLDSCGSVADGGHSEPVMIEFTIMPDGGVADVREEAISPVATCVVKQLRRWSFPHVKAPEPMITLWTASVEGGGVSFLSAEGGGLNKDVIKGTIQRHSPRVRSCYERRLQERPELCGMVRLRWLITRSGATSEVEVEVNESGDERLSACVVDEVKSWAFARPFGGGSVAVTFPWVFLSKDGTDAGAQCCSGDAGSSSCTRQP